MGRLAGRAQATVSRKEEAVLACRVVCRRTYMRELAERGASRKVLAVAVAPVVGMAALAVVAAAAAGAMKVLLIFKMAKSDLMNMIMASNSHGHILRVPGNRLHFIRPIASLC